MYSETARLELTDAGIRDMDTGEMVERFGRNDPQDFRRELFAKLCNDRDDARNPENADWRRLMKRLSYKAF